MIAALVTLALSPWTGPSLPTASPAAVKYRLAVHGRPHENVRLRATGLAQGWIATFCTARFCSPQHSSLDLDGSGNGAVEFAVIRIDDAAPAHTRVTVSASNGESKSLAIGAPQAGRKP